MEKELNTPDLSDGLDLPDAAINAYLKLIELNMASWQPHISQWLHSEDAEPSVKQLLALVPCSPTLH
jgi:hypothetical protein